MPASLMGEPWEAAAERIAAKIESEDDYKDLDAKCRKLLTLCRRGWHHYMDLRIKLDRFAIAKIPEDNEDHAALIRALKQQDGELFTHESQAHAMLKRLDAWEGRRTRRKTMARR